MNIYILTYSHRTFLDSSKIVSGIDVAALSQYKILKELGHDVRIFSAQTNLDPNLYNVDFFTTERQPDVKKYGKVNKKNIQKRIIENIYDFKPDIIISNYELSNFYTDLMNLSIPIVYVLHSVPGFWTDFLNANLLHSMTNSIIGGMHTFCCVSDYHRKKVIKYYKSVRKDWNFSEIIPDHIFYPQYCVPEEIQPSDGVIRHVSAASKGKDTFLINIYLEDTNRKVETFTTLGHQSKDQLDDYIVNSLKKYSKDIQLDADHSDIMTSIGKSEITFVGNHSVDTFTITSLESLSRGVPLILKDRKGHPATEMIPDEYQKYLKLIKTKKEFLLAVSELEEISLEERKELALATNEKMGKSNYIKNIQEVISSAIDKFNENENKNKEDLW